LASWRAVLAVLVRVVPAVVFIDVIRVGISTITELYPAGLGTVLTNPRLLIVAGSGVSAVFAVVFGSVPAYSVALVLLILSELPALPVYTDHVAISRTAVSVPWVGIAGIFAVLVLDTLVTVYRPGGFSPSRQTLKRVAVTVASFLAIIAPLTLVSLVFATYFTDLVGALREATTSLARTPLYFIAGSLTTGVALILIAIYALSKVLNSSTEILTLFLIPSRNVSLRALTEGEDLDRVFSPPLVGIVLGLAALAFYPAIYTLLFRVILQPVTNYLTSLLPSLAVHTLLNIASFALTLILVRGVVGTHVVPEVRARTVAYSITVLTLFYIAAVKVSIDGGASLAEALLSPNLDGVIQLIRVTYLDYSYYLITFTESLLRFLGVAP